jgi:hypothetical protein
MLGSAMTWRSGGTQRALAELRESGQRPSATDACAALLSGDQAAVSRARPRVRPASVAGAGRFESHLRQHPDVRWPWRNFEDRHLLARLPLRQVPLDEKNYVRG